MRPPWTSEGFRRYTVGRSAVTGGKNTGLRLFLLVKESAFPVRPENFVSRGVGEISLVSGKFRADESSRSDCPCPIGLFWLHLLVYV